MNIAIIGAGLSGAVLSHHLQSDHSVTVLEKSRGAGGRLATRRQDNLAWDHGAPYFTARTPEFQQFLEPARASGSIVDWTPTISTLHRHQKSYKRLWFEPHLIGQPNMKAWLNDLINPNLLFTETEVLGITGAAGNWFLTTNNSLQGPFDWVLSTAPAPQSEGILAPFLPELGVTYAPGLTLLATTTHHRAKWQMAICNDPIVDQIILMSSRFGRLPGNPVVIHTQRDWAKAHLEQPLDQSKSQIEQAVKSLDDLEITQGILHRWRYAKVEQPAAIPFWIEPDLQLGACGDWFGLEGAESAFTSTSRLLIALEEHLMH
ncbi:MAG: NAD(P)/FAD-dependent oxidoreductase [Pseudomonadales bacterium]